MQHVFQKSIGQESEFGIRLRSLTLILYNKGVLIIQKSVLVEFYLFFPGTYCDIRSAWLCL